MGTRILFTGIALLMASGVVTAQQEPDLEYKPPLPRPAYESGKGPRLAIDEAHYNFHTAEGRYKPFAELLRRDGYRVDALKQLLSTESLKGVDVLVISNALHKRNARRWAPPNPSAFTKDEITAVHSWVEKGGSLLLIADHPPFAGAASELAKAFGVEWSNGHALAGHWLKVDDTDIFESGTGLKESIITRGRRDDEKITKIATYAGSAFKAPKDAIPVLQFGPKSQSQERKATEDGEFEIRKIPIEGWCQGAVMKVGKGRLALFGEAAMFSAQRIGDERFGMNSPEAKDNHQLLLNVMHWLSRAEGMKE